MTGRRAWPRSVGEWGRLAEVLLLLALLRGLLFGVQLQTLLRWLDALGRYRPVDPGTLERTARFTDALLARLAFPLPGKCLPRSLVLYAFARRARLPVHFHCGVRRAGSRLEGHAWLTLDGRPFLERGDPVESFAVTLTHPEPESSPHSPTPVVGSPDASRSGRG
jgi:hypothetical protein